MRVFKIVSSETDHFCGATLVEALQGYFQQTGSDIFEFDCTDEIEEIPEGEWGSIVFNYEGRGEITLRKYMEENPPIGIICSTAY